MRRRDAHLVDPELRRLVGVDVVNRSGESDDQPVVEGHRDVMARVFEEPRAPPRVDRLVEDSGRDPREKGFVAAPQ